jgi:hypothetical protein
MARMPGIDRFDAFVRRYGFKRIDSLVGSAETSLPTNLDDYVIVRPITLEEAEKRENRASRTSSGNGNGNGNGNGRGVPKPPPN